MVVEREIAQLPIYDRYIVKLKSNDFYAIQRANTYRKY
jgi:hypothetical protein